MPTLDELTQDLADLIDGDYEDGLGALLEPIRQTIADLKVTVIVMYRGHDAEMFTQVIEGELTEEQRDEWRKTHKCDQHCDVDEDDGDDYNNMFFRTLPVRSVAAGMCDLANVDAPFGAVFEDEQAAFYDEGVEIPE